MLSRRRWADLLAVAAFAAVATHYAVFVIRRRALLGIGVPSFDIYNEIVPNLIYALHSLERGEGLLWINLQNCGQPFFALIHMGLLNPLNVLFLIVDLHTALLGFVIVNLTVAGTGVYWLARHYRLGRAAAACGALTFELGGFALQLASWVPANGLGAYAWLPVAFLACERVIANASLRTAAGLAGALAVQFLAGQPQISLFTYQLIAARVVWELVALGRPRSFRFLVPVALGCVLAPGLAAVQLVPSAEMTRLSLRGARPLTAGERNPIVATWSGFREGVGQRCMGWGSMFAAVPVALAAAALTRHRKRRLPLLFVVVALLSGALTFGRPLYDLYAHLPLGSMFRSQQRFLWVTAFAFSVLVAFGARAIMEHSASRLVSRGVFLFPLAGIGGFWLLSPSGIHRWEWLLLAAAAVASAARSALPRAGWAPSLALPALVGVNMASVVGPPFQTYLKDLSVYYRHADAFAFAKQRMTLQDRIDHLGVHADFSLMEKSATIFEVPAVRDYEPLTSVRYGEMMVALLKTPEVMARLRADQPPMRDINDYTFFTDILPQSRALLNLLAARYLLVDVRKDHSKQGLFGLTLLTEINGVRIYENPSALPRAFFTPRLAVTDDPVRLLRRLLSPEHDPRKVALVETPPADGFVGTAAGGTGRVEIVSDRSEEVVIDSRASSPGFLFLSDQFYPGWEASVDGAPTPILRANYAFRAVRVPAGDARIVFR
jgi:hypothetical protein